MWARRKFATRMWARNLVSIRAVTALLSSFGALWLVVEMVAFFAPQSGAADVLRSLWWLFALVGILGAVSACRPQLSVAHKLDGRDITIEIVIGDIFGLPGALVVGTNTTFDTRVSRELISDRSIQGRFTKLYYGDETQLDVELDAALGPVPYQDLGEPRKGKSKRYPMGTAVRLNPRERTAYFLAIADLNENGVATSTFDDVRDSLAELWFCVGSRGSKEPLLMPVLGTGFSRLSQPRELVVREIVKSFVAACSERTFIDRLTIVLAPQDVLEHQISLASLGDFVRHVCTYTEFADASSRAVGTAA